MGSPTITSKKRIRLVAILLLAGFLYIGIKLFWAQVVQSPELQRKALRQWTRNTVISAARGKILDCEGNVLAQSATAYKILIWPAAIEEEEKDRIIDELTALLEPAYPRVNREYIEARVRKENVSEVLLIGQIDRETADAVKALKLGEGVVVANDTKRYYPNNELLSQVLGYTTIDGDGQDGLELKYNKYLKGENGRLMTERDNRGNSVAYGDQEYI